MKKGWRTLLVALIVAIFGVLETFDFTNVITGENASWIISLIGLVMAFLRKITTTALGAK